MPASSNFSFYLVPCAKCNQQPVGEKHFESSSAWKHTSNCHTLVTTPVQALQYGDETSHIPRNLSINQSNFMLTYRHSCVIFHMVNSLFTIWFIPLTALFEATSLPLHCVHTCSSTAGVGRGGIHNPSVSLAFPSFVVTGSGERCIPGFLPR